MLPAPTVSQAVPLNCLTVSLLEASVNKTYGAVPELFKVRCAPVAVPGLVPTATHSFPASFLTVTGEVAPSV